MPQLTPFEVTIIGSHSYKPAYRLHPTSQLLTIGNTLVLLDCGEGTQFRLMESGKKWGRISAIFITHLHGDHVFGLAPLLSTYSLQGRTATLEVFGPKGIEELLHTQLRLTECFIQYPLVIIETDANQAGRVVETPYFTVDRFPLKHRIPAQGYLFREKPGLLNLRKEALEQYNIERSAILPIKQGKDYQTPEGQWIDNTLLTFPPPPARAYAVCTDTEYDERLIPIIQGVDLLYHEATFLHSDVGKAVDTGHSTAQEAATIAKAAGVGRLLIGHFSGRYMDANALLAEALGVFPQTAIAEEGTTFPVGASGVVGNTLQL